MKLAEKCAPVPWSEVLLRSLDTKNARVARGVGCARSPALNPSLVEKRLSRQMYQMELQLPLAESVTCDHRHS